MGKKSSPIAPKAPTIPSKASSAIATDASVTIAAGHTGELVTIAETIAVAREVSVGVTVRETVSLGNTHNTQTPERVYKRNRDHAGTSQSLLYVDVDFVFGL